MAAGIPCALVTSCSSTFTRDWLVQHILGTEDLLVEATSNDTKKAQERCIKHGFELVELSPEELPEEDDDFPESTGVKQIVQALNANVWSNAVMKNDRSQGFSLLNSLAATNHSIGSAETCHSEQSHLPAADRTESLPEHQDGASNTAGAQVDSIVDPMLDLDIQELASLTT
ncbi:Alpha- and gamma-adaptin-binding protein p34 [Sciurus carolinensis]|uniref:Alpha- and gamma-adaptin-binding protein p34 n=1 Tax=Sciurus carolinensis TaxID=30640 RepID=A0AA41ME34_SCICA|nr:Alpha- and gamma-adaptin-binding protein p34 [Sciurus carolinensis]